MRSTALVLFLAALTGAPSSVLAIGPESPDGYWSAVETVPFPVHVSPPTAYAAARLDVSSFLLKMRSAPAAPAHLPLPDGSFVQVTVRSDATVDPEIVAAFPDLHTFTFESADGKVRGRLRVGPGGIYVSGQAPNRLLRIEPVQTAQGVFYLSFFDCDRTDTATIAAQLPRR